MTYEFVETDFKCVPIYGCTTTCSKCATVHHSNLLLTKRWIWLTVFYNKSFSNTL